MKVIIQIVWRIIHCIKNYTKLLKLFNTSTKKMIMKLYSWGCLFFNTLHKWVTFFDNNIKPKAIMRYFVNTCNAKLNTLVFNKLYKLSRFFGDHPLYSNHSSSMQRKWRHVLNKWNSYVSKVVISLKKHILTMCICLRVTQIKWMYESTYDILAQKSYHNLSSTRFVSGC